MSTDKVIIEEFVSLHGEWCRDVLDDALWQLDGREPSWELKRPIGRKAYLRGVLREARPGKGASPSKFSTRGNY